MCLKLLKLTSSRIVDLTVASPIDWLSVFQFPQQRTDPQFISFLQIFSECLHRNHFQRENFLIAYSGRTPAAVARISFNQSLNMLAISDFVYLPDKKNVARSLIHHILKKGREKHVTRVVSWMASSGLSSIDVLGEFLFEPRKIHLLGQAILKRRPKCSTAKVELHHDKNHLPPLEMLRHDGLLPLQKLLTLQREGWAPCICNVDEETNEIQAIGYCSKKRRQTGWVMFSQSTEQSYPPSERIVTLLLPILQYLFDNGVRTIYSEFNGEYTYQIALQNVGFDVISTIYQMSFEYAYKF